MYEPQCFERAFEGITFVLWKGRKLFWIWTIFSLLDSATFLNEIRTSDGGNGNHSVSLPIILIKIKFDQMLLSSYISSPLVSFFMILYLISYFHKCTALFLG